MREDIYITSHKFGKEFYISVEDFKKAVNEIQNKYRALEEENKKLKEDVDFFYKSAKQFREQVEKWEKDFVEGRIVEKD